MQDGSATKLFWLGLSSETWAIVLATAFGPIAAILITRWRDWVRDVKGRRMYVFRALLATRRQAITPDHVAALNPVEIEFYGIKSIENAWTAYHRHLHSGPRDRPMTSPESKFFDDQRNEMLAKLLFSIARFLGYTMSELDIKNGGYAPDGWRYRDERMGLIQEFAKDVALGLRAFPVTTKQPEPDTQGSPPTPQTGP